MTLTANVYREAPRPTPEQLEELNREMNENDVVDKGHTATPAETRVLSPETARPSHRSPNATTIIRDSIVPQTGIKGGRGYASFTQEPSTDSWKTHIFQSGNWYATRSLNNGATWSYLDPFTLFGSGFCCDQVTRYDKATARQFWLLQYDNHLVLANASASGASAYTNWCYYNIDATWFGLPAGTTLDYNDMVATNNNISVSTNFFGTGTSGSAMLRLPKAAMSTCSGFSYSRFNRTDSFTFKLVQGSASTLYFGSNWGQINGSTFRMYWWPEDSGSYFWIDYNIAPYGFYTRNSGQNCASTDGVVTNWCQFADSRVLGGYRSHGVIGFSFNAKQDASHPFPYTRLVWFRESDDAYLGAGDLWGSWGAIQFATFAPNATTLAGGMFAWGGGTGSTHYYPGAATYSTPLTSVATDPNYFLWGDGNTCTYGGLYRWGDYLTVRGAKSNKTRWIGSAYAIKGGSCGSGTDYAEPHNVIFS